MDIRIAILQSGWVFVGRYSKDGPTCCLDGGFCIRRWGTTEGLGQLAMSGPLSATVLEPTPRIEFHELAAVATIACAEEKWRDVVR